MYRKTVKTCEAITNVTVPHGAVCSATLVRRTDNVEHPDQNENTYGWAHCREYTQKTADNRTRGINGSEKSWDYMMTSRHHIKITMEQRHAVLISTFTYEFLLVKVHKCNKDCTGVDGGNLQELDTHVRRRGSRGGIRARITEVRANRKGSCLCRNNYSSSPSSASASSSSSSAPFSGCASPAATSGATTAAGSGLDSFFGGT